MHVFTILSLRKVSRYQKVIRRTDNTVAKEKGTNKDLQTKHRKTNNDLQRLHRKTNNDLQSTT